MVQYDQVFGGLIENLKREGRYRVFANIGREVGEYPYAHFKGANGEKRVAVWCSNDYLGMGHHPAVLRAMVRTTEELGAGAGGTRNISGTHPTIVELEHELARVHQKEAALVFSSGYVANEAALSTIPALLPNCLVLSDENNHASMIHGIRGSKSEKVVFRHNDLNHLEELLKAAGPDRAKLVAFESLYSMEGDIAPIRKIAELCRRYNALSYIDETHAVGVYGEHGGGIVEREGLQEQIDIIQGGLGKGYGVVGGFIAGSERVVDVVRSYGGSFIFTTALPPVVSAGALASVRHLASSNAERTKLHQRVKELKSAIYEAALPLMPGDGHMLPIVVGDSALCKAVTDHLMESHDIYIQPINYPTVPRGTERLRVTISPLHSSTDILNLVESLVETWQRFGLPLRGVETASAVHADAPIEREHDAAV